VKTIDELIDALSSSSCSIEDALIKAQILAHGLGDKEMTAWVKAELSGYPSGTDVPDYRMQVLTVIGTIGNGVYFYKDQRLPLSSLTPAQKAALVEQRVRQGVGAVEHLCKQEDEGKRFAITVQPEWFGPLSKLCTPGYSVQQAYAHPPPGGARQILTEIRSRLLDFALQLRDRVPAGTDPAELKTAVGPEVVRSLFENAMGANITVIFNSGAIGHVSTDIRVNDLESLNRALSQEGISKEGLTQLEGAIAKDANAQEHGSKKLGKAVLDWIADTTKGVAKTGAQTAVKAALQHFYGF
jgi:AbiTii